MVDKLFTATKAFISYNEKVLILRESSEYEDGTNLNKYDVPGGRIKPRQRYDESLFREVKEETGLEIKIGRPFHVDEWRPQVMGEAWQITGIFFECFSDSDNIILSKDHNRFKWINPQEYRNFNLIPGLERAFESYLTFNRR